MDKITVSSILLVATGTAIIMTACSGDGVKPDPDGNFTLGGSAECRFEREDANYTIFLNVKADKDGNIISVEDAGTQISEGKDGKYKQAQILFDELKGKNIDTVDEVDGVSGATVSCDGIKSAVKDALSSMKG